MARKHTLKRDRVSQYVPRTLVTPEQTERKIVLNPVTNLFEVQHVVVKPAIYKQGTAGGPTLKQRGKPNVPPTTKSTGGKK
jgi:hypothetical protein